MAKFFEKVRALFFFLIILAAMSLCAVMLMKIQVVDGAYYLEMAESTSIVKQDIYAPRGEIVDISGREIVSNKVGYNVILEKAFLPSDKQEMNRIIIEIAHILEEDGVKWLDTLPITAEKPYVFLDSRESDIARMRTNINVQPYATAENCIDEMIKQYEISDSYTEKEKRIIAGVRHEMVLHSFSLSNRYTFAEDIPMATVVKLKEASYRLEGMDVVEEAIRVYKSGTAAPHIIGTIGSINVEEYAELKEDGYMLNDTLGKSGIEKAMETELRGSTGTRSLEILH